MADVRVGGLERLSLCDWPGELVATVFLQGCPWSCGYCHNPHLIPAIPERARTGLDWEAVLAFLSGRRGLLDGVVFSGGEPTLQAALPEAMRAVRDMGFRIGLHTGGPYPARLAAVLPLTDWVGFDVKAPFDDYADTTATPGSGAKARDSLRLLLDSDVSHEVRTTVHPALLDETALARMRTELNALGVVGWKRQPFRPDGVSPQALEALEARQPVRTRA